MKESTSDTFSIIEAIKDITKKDKNTQESVTEEMSETESFHVSAKKEKCCLVKKVRFKWVY